MSDKNEAGEIPELPDEQGSVNIYDENDIRGVTSYINKKIIKGIIFVCGVVVTGIPVYEVLFNAFPPHIQRPVHLMLMFIITLILYPSGFFKKYPKAETSLNLALILFVIGFTVWASKRWVYLCYINPSPSDYETIAAFIFVLIAFEATRRAIGIPMAIISGCFIIYCFIGPYMPRAFAHIGFEPRELVTHLVIGTEGMMGNIMAIGATQIVFFMLFAAFLKMSNATALFMNFSKSIAGNRIGGPAKVCVVSTAIVSMVSGSASGNVATTGSVTIPLMVSMGFKKRMAAAIEATSSTAGQFSPPIMGAAAFVIAEYTGNAYWNVCVAAFLPSFFYFAGMFLVVEIIARRLGIKGLDKSELPPLKRSTIEVLPLIIPITVLVTLLALMYSPQYSIIWSIITLVVCSLFFRKTVHVNIKKIFKALALTGKIMIPVTTSCACCGFVVGVMSLTGFGDKLAYGILAVANGNLFIGLLFTAAMCIIIGMGLPTLAAYIVLATLGVPALTSLGAPLLAAHMFVFYCAILSAITPPVCLACFVAAGIAGENPLKVSFTSVGMAPFIYILPFLFVFFPGLLINGCSLLTIAHHVAILILFIFPIIALSRKFWLVKLTIAELLFFSAAITSLFVFKNYNIVFMLAFNLVAGTMHVLRFNADKNKLSVA
ncbi:MAG: TRAP transporter fused permease subunit [Spirochaetaceae bacterium]|nr:TRAP transporter fused permease subunit [Spirochaetaceae bacterium]